MRRRTKLQRRVLRRKSTRDLREDISKALAPDKNSLVGKDVKVWIRSRHSTQRTSLLERMRPFLEQHEEALLEQFAAGQEVDPRAIAPAVVEVRSEADVRLFRYAALHWSVPVSGGFGRRTRFLLKDQQNGKLIGIFVLSDPVYNLSCRDKVIGWTDRQKRRQLYRVLDASVLGAVPPYSYLLGGKLVALATLSSQTLDLVERKYRGRKTVIKKRILSPRPVLITTTSALGRSSIYNRLALDGRRFYEAIGWTKGYGHFQLPEELFDRLLRVLDTAQVRKARSYAFGNGPSWKLRTLRVGLEFLGLDPALQRHGIRREVFIAPTASNWRAMLLGEQSHARWFHDDLEELAARFRERWAVPRSHRAPEYRAFDPISLRLFCPPQPLALTQAI